MSSVSLQKPTAVVSSSAAGTSDDDKTIKKVEVATAAQGFNSTTTTATSTKNTTCLSQHSHSTISSSVSQNNSSTSTTSNNSNLSHSQATTTESMQPPKQQQQQQYPDDLDMMICHQDFSKLLTLAAKVKSLRESIVAHENNMEDTAAAVAIMKSRRGKNSKRKNELDPDDVINAVTRMQSQLVKFNNNNNKKDNSSQPPMVVTRGTYPLTDSLLDDSFSILQKELDFCEQWLLQRQALMKKKKKSEQQQQQTEATGSSNKKKRKHSTSEAIAIKYSKWQYDILMDWIIQHKDQPFPNANEIQDLTRKTGLSQSQVVNWTTNVRKRNRKATCEGGKKPHHFIDFLFLAQDRDNRRGSEGFGVVASNTSGSVGTHNITSVPTVHHQSSATKTSNQKKETKLRKCQVSPPTVPVHPHTKVAPTANAHYFPPPYNPSSHGPSASKYPYHPSATGYSFSDYNYYSNKGTPTGYHKNPQPAHQQQQQQQPQRRKRAAVSKRGQKSQLRKNGKAATVKQQQQENNNANEKVHLVVPSFDDSQLLEPIDMYEDIDVELLQDFAKIWGNLDKQEDSSGDLPELLDEPTVHDFITQTSSSPMGNYEENNNNNNNNNPDHKQLLPAVTNIDASSIIKSPPKLVAKTSLEFKLEELDLIDFAQMDDELLGFASV